MQLGPTDGGPWSPAEARITGLPRWQATVRHVPRKSPGVPRWQRLPARSHLHTGRGNLTIEKDDFEHLPVFADFGGWGNADKDFRGQLMPLVQEISTAIAA